MGLCARTAHPSTVPTYRGAFPKSAAVLGGLPRPPACAHHRESGSRHSRQAPTTPTHWLSPLAASARAEPPSPVRRRCRPPAATAAPHWPMIGSHAYRSVRPFKANSPHRPAWSPSHCHPIQSLGVFHFPHTSCATGAHCSADPHPCASLSILLPHEHIYKEAYLLFGNPLSSTVFLPIKSFHRGALFQLPTLAGASTPHGFPASMCRS
jgi:hypothetical protein